MTKQVEDMGMSLGVSSLDRWKGNLVWSFSRDISALKVQISSGSVGLLWNTVKD